MIVYPAEFEYEKDTEMYGVVLSDIKRCYTCAPSYKEAVKMAQEVLTIALEERLQSRKSIPRPSAVQGAMVGIAPSAEIALALWLRWQREDRHLSPKQMAAECQLAEETYQKLEAGTEPTVGMLANVGRSLGQSVFAF